VIATALGVGVATAQRSSENKSSTLSEKDKAFMRKAAKGGMMEVAMGRLAEQKAQSDDVKSFGKRMVTDHGKANDELKSIAQQKNVQLPSKEPTEKWTFSTGKSFGKISVENAQILWPLPLRDRK
jgi:predicted outer membrane protein